MSNLKLYLLAVLTTLTWSSMAADNPFDPSNPPEPNNDYVPSHIITVKAIPEGMGYTSGSGKYKEGKSATISTSAAVANWVFKEWLIDGELYTAQTSKSFTFTVGTHDVTFTAVYEYVEPTQPEDPDPPTPPVLPPFDPASPGDPQAPETPQTPDPDPDPPTPPVVIPKYSLTLVSDPFEACSFNISSGNKYTAGTRVALKATGNQDFVFDGWFDAEGTLLSDMTSWVYEIPESDTTVFAKWTFDPDSPTDPEGTPVIIHTNILGDVNDDYNVTILDVMITLSHTLGGNLAKFNPEAADMNSDGVITIVDIMQLINIVSAH